MHANQFRRLALAQGLLPVQSRSTPGGGAVSSVEDADEPFRATLAAEQTPETLH